MADRLSGISPAVFSLRMHVDEKISGPVIRKGAGTWNRFTRLLCAGLVVLFGLFAFLVRVGAVESLVANPGRPFSYIHDEQKSVPWSIHIIKLDRNSKDFEFQTTLGESNAFGMAVVSEQVKFLPSELGEPVAAVNGDFYFDKTYPGDPRDVQIHRGELVSAPSGHACFWIDVSGAPNFGNVQSRLRVVWPDGTTSPIGLNEERAASGVVLFTPTVGGETRTENGLEVILGKDGEAPWLPLKPGKTYSAKIREVRPVGNTAVAPGTAVLSIDPNIMGDYKSLAPGQTIRLVMETVPDLSGVNTAIGGGPALVRNGKALEWTGIQMRHPRTALGWNKDHFFLVEVDGRQSQLSLGMTLPELATYMAKLGCEQAMNLDGGGSATLWAMGNVMNSPSEGRERPGANALVLVRKRSPAK